MRLKSSSGFSLVEMLAIVAILAISLSATLIISVRSSQDVMTAPIVSQLDVFRRNIVSGVMDTNSWAKTVAKNPALNNCVNAGSCPIGFGNAQTFALYEAREPSGAPLDALIYDSNRPRLGVSTEGTLCTTFDALNPDPHCPYKFDMRWYAISGGSNPQIAVFATLQMSPFLNASYGKISIGKYSIGTCSGPMVSSAGLLRCTNVINPLLRSGK